MHTQHTYLQGQPQWCVKCLTMGTLKEKKKTKLLMTCSIWQSSWYKYSHCDWSQWSQATTMKSPNRIEKGTSLAVQWLRLCLPMQGVWIWFLVWELKYHVPCAQKKKTTTTTTKHEKKEEEEAIVKYSIKTFKMVLIRVEKISTQSPSWTGESPFQHSTGRPALAKPRVALWTGLGRASELSRIWKLDFPVWCFCFKVVQAHESLSLES